MEAPIEIPNFEILKELGRGGMAKVYLARQLQPKRKVAIKIVAPTTGQDDSFMESLKLEGDMAAQCSHTNIVTVYACGVIEHHYYLAMELLSGGDLTARIKKEALEADEALIILKEMASALEHAHSINLLHRDIKPENIMFHESGKAVLVDFGIAKEQDTESNFTKAGAVVGTPHYMSPERATGKPINARSDLYALGVVFYEMLTGHKLFEGADTFAISYKHVYEAIPQLPAPHQKYQRLLNKMVAKDPDDRFQNATELLKALEEPTGPAAAPPPSDGSFDMANSATMAVSPDALASLADMPAPAGAAAQSTPAPAPAKKLPLVPIGIAATVVLGAAVAFVALRGGDDAAGSAAGGNVRIGQGQNLDVAERQRMQELLAAATSMSRINNYEAAENNLFKVLSEYDCKNEEARRGLAALNPARADEIVQMCDQ